MQRSREDSSPSRPTVNEPFKHSASVRSYPDSRGAVVIKLKNRKSMFIVLAFCFQQKEIIIFVGISFVKFKTRKTLFGLVDEYQAAAAPISGNSPPRSLCCPKVEPDHK